MLNLKMLGKLHQGEAVVHRRAAEKVAYIAIDKEQPWSPEELRQVASLLQSAATLMEA
jgi:hypothetical protein